MTDTHERGPHGGGVTAELATLTAIPDGFYTPKPNLAAHAASVVAMDGEDDREVMQADKDAVTEWYDASMAGASEDQLAMLERAFAAHRIAARGASAATTNDDEVLKEAMAQAMFVDWMGNDAGLHSSPPWSDLDDDIRAQWLSSARAALAAYRSAQVQP